MSLSLAYQIARGALSASSTAASVVSRNVASSGDPSAAARTVRLVTDLAGGARVTGIGNAVDVALLERSLESNSAASGLAVIAGGLDRLHAVIGDTEAGSSPTALLGKLRDALQLAASAPHDNAAVRAVLTTADSLAIALNRGADLVFEVRAQAHDELRQGVEQLESLLVGMQTANREIALGHASGRDVTDSIDRRNSLLRELSGLVDVRVATRGQDEMVVFLASGAVLLETSPREVALEGPGALAPGQLGPSLCLDDWPVQEPGILGGRLGGLLRLRDEIALTFGRQLDEIARGLVVATAESDQSVTPTQPDLAGLFTYADGPTIPPQSVVADGIAASVRVNPSVDPAIGGVLTRLRDGGVSAPGDLVYVSNPSGASGFNGRLLELVERLTAVQVFDPAAVVGSGGAGLIGFASESAGWLEQQRSEAHSRLSDFDVQADRSLSAWQNRVGINIDDEMTRLIALERSFQASSRLITSVTSMFDALLRAVE
jgi:flagellar hook-associated protein 1 FlgK